MNNRPAEVTAAIEILQTRSPGYQTAKDTLLAYIETLEAANGWRDIGEAPNEKMVLAWGKTKPDMISAIYKSALYQGEWLILHDMGHRKLVEVTKWQPLPTPPSPASKGE